ncbi:MAG: alpha/beta fold hydrolase [Erysipelotrichaceae bacterium]
MIHYDEYGRKNAPVIIMLGGAGTLDTFAHQYFLSANYHLIVPHLPGSGVNADVLYNPENVKKELFELIESFNQQVGIIGHSLGGQLVVMLISERQELFKWAIVLSAMVKRDEKMLKSYSKLAKTEASMMKWKWLIKLQGLYWGFNEKQIEYMAEYSARMTPEVFASFFENTMDINDYDYLNIKIPVLAICGKSELKIMKESLEILSLNRNIETVQIKGSHDFPMRQSAILNNILIDFIKETD